MASAKSSQSVVSNNFKIGIHLAGDEVRPEHANKVQTIEFANRDLAQTSIDKMYAFDLITKAEWDRITNILSEVKTTN